MKTCITCSMPLEGEHEKDWAMDLPEGPVCKFDSENGKLKSPDEIFEGGVNFFAHQVANGDRELAERLSVKNMKLLPYWQAHPFEKLEGQEATEEEFGQAMQKLSEAN